MGAIERIAVVGLGLIGGSFFKASRKAGFATVGLHHGDGRILSLVPQTAD